VTAGTAMTDDVERLERQVERSHIRFQSLLNRTSERIRELETIVHGLVEILARQGHVSRADLDTATGRAANLETRADAEPQVILRPPATDDQPAEVIVDCAARMHVCHAVCCKLTVALSGPEVESGRLRWDLGRPYVLRREADGACTHNDRSTGFCGVYADRPQPCRQYTCATDGRIWKDFEGMELNTDWLEAHFKPDEPVFVQLDPRPPSRTTA
jgi:Fe-S-cluster containining protein